MSTYIGFKPSENARHMAENMKTKMENFELLYEHISWSKPGASPDLPKHRRL